MVHGGQMANQQKSDTTYDILSCDVSFSSSCFITLCSFSRTLWPIEFRVVQISIYSVINLYLKPKIIVINKNNFKIYKMAYNT